MFADIETVLKAYHEAGHAVVGHVVGRCIESVALLTGENGYGGYCRFSAYAEDANGHPEWQNGTSYHDLLMIYYAGMLSTAHYCVQYLALDEEEDGIRYPEGSEQNDLEKIQEILSGMELDQQQREAVTDTCWKQAQLILSKYSIIVDEIARALMEQGSLTGQAVHCMIWRTAGYPEDDWRFVALGIKPRTN